MRIVHQSVATECGLACLAMVMSHHKVDVELRELRALAPPSSNGTRLRQLIDVSARYGLVARAVRAEMGQLGKLLLPAILHWEFSHFVVLEALTGETAVVLDPGVGRQKISLRDLSDRFTGVALEFRTSSSLTPVRRLMKASLSDFWTSSRGFAATIAALGLLSVTIQCLLLASPLILATLVDDAIRLRSPKLALTLGAGAVALALITALGEALRRSSLVDLGARLNAQINLNLSRHLLSLDFTFFLNRRLNDLLSRVNSTRAIRDALTEEALPTIVDGLFAMCTAAIVFLISPLAGCIMLGSLGVYLTAKHISFPSLRERRQRAIEALSAERGILTDTLRGISTVKLMNGEPSRINAWCGANLRALVATQRERDLVVKLGAARSAVGATDLAMVAVAAAMLVMDGSLSFGGLMALLIYRQQFQERALMLVDRAHELRLLGLHFERLSDIVNARPELPTGTAPSGLRVVAGGLECNDLWFRHSADGPWVLRGASFEVRPGEFVAVCGRSGGGKTTLLRVVTGLLSPSAGRVVVDGETLAASDFTALRDQVGVVLQDDQLFAGTVLENISGWDIPVDIARVEACARLACIHDEIERLPMGYFTLMGDLGSSLSGGQRQRLFIARAMYRQPRIVILDEGTANLDGALEATILENLRATGATIICIAHRQTAIALAERVLTLVDGRIETAAAAPRSRVASQSPAR